MNTNFNQFIVVQDHAESFDEAGGYQKEWVNKYELWASIESLFNKRQIGNELAFAKQIHSASYYQIIVRYVGDLNTDMRIAWDKKTLSISKIIGIDNKRQYLMLIAYQADYNN